MNFLFCVVKHVVLVIGILNGRQNYWFGKTVRGKHALNTGRGGCGREGDLAAAAVTPLISRVDSADLTD